MKREREEELRSNRGAPSIFFFDLSSMSGTGALLYIASIVAFFLLIFYVLINKLISKPVDFQKQKKSSRTDKKSSGKAASGTASKGKND